MENKKNCFIIMPLTTPEFMLTKYRDGKEHFKHILDCLFVPAIEKAEYNPIPPIAKGSDIIHAEIIQNLETSDIVLCDMSCLNPNVFFEFGIRTSLNKPVCVVKDELTEKIPFDTGIIHYYEYKGSLEPWHLEDEKNKLAKHIKTSVERSKGKNSLWRYFGLKFKAFSYEGDSYEGETGMNMQIEYLKLQMDSLNEKIDLLGQNFFNLSKPILSKIRKPSFAAKSRAAELIMKKLPISDEEITITDGTYDLIVRYSKGIIPEKEIESMKNLLIDRYGVSADFLKD